MQACGVIWWNLDKAVDQAYSYKDTGSEPDRVAFLFELYEGIVK